MIDKCLSWAVALTLLCGCATTEPDESLLLVHGPAEVAGTTPAWCYSTLADADCYVQRDLSATHRLIGAYVPVPPFAVPDPEVP
jgi:hypothetical protein